MLHPYRLSQITQKFLDVGGSGRITLMDAVTKTHLDIGSPIPTQTTILGLCIENASKRNAISPKMMVDLKSICDHLESTIDGSNVYGILMFGASNTFCSGFDLSVARERFLMPEEGLDMSLFMQDTLLRLSRIPIVSCCCIDGFAVGGGAEVTLIADHRIIKADGTMQFVHKRMGVSPGFGGSQRLSRLLGKSKALRILLEASKLDSKKCYDIGLVDQISSNSSSVDSGIEWLSILVKSDGKSEPISPKVIRGLKRSILSGDNEDEIMDAFSRERLVFGSLWGSGQNLKALKK